MDISGTALTTGVGLVLTNGTSAMTALSAFVILCAKNIMNFSILYNISCCRNIKKYMK